MANHENQTSDNRDRMIKNEANIEEIRTKLSDAITADDMDKIIELAEQIKALKQQEKEFKDEDEAEAYAENGERSILEDSKKETEARLSELKLRDAAESEKKVLETLRSMTDNNLESDKSSIIQNQIKFNYGEEVSQVLQEQGFDVSRSGYKKVDGKEVDDNDINEFKEANLEYCIETRNIAGSEVSINVNLADNFNLVDRSGRALSEFIKEKINQEDLWRRDDDFRIVIDDLTEQSFAVILRNPRYSDNNEIKKFDTFTIVVEIKHDTYVDDITRVNAMDSIKQNLRQKLEVPVDYDQIQQSFREALRNI